MRAGHLHDTHGDGLDDNGWLTHLLESESSGLPQVIHLAIPRMRVS